MQKQLKDIATIKFGFYVKSLEKGFAKYLQAKNFDDFGNLQSDIDSFVNLDNKNESHLLEDGDVLFVGKGFRNFAWTYNKAMGPAIASSIFYVIRPKKTKVNPEYIATLFNSQKYQSQFQSMGAGSSIPSIRKGELESIIIDVPDLDLQNKIATISALHSEEIKLSNQIIENKKALFQGIINKIVTGQYGK
ncbi:restriction endonuclease subunit S [Flavobacterium sp. 5]|uniref:restriction endonuclease subunit S n=1 Tax=Flavobacterium sp. 5 TaxID=2035199 RepID=UPI000C2C1989|nr:restriction endonuclease subunit S [Flavobacterium sp. 5]PKB18826.1 type I restriction modification DNA specificity protein [Flavobacterium sp. 5]